MTTRVRAALGAAGVSILLAAAFVICCGQEYTLIFKNESTNVGTACIFQHDPDMDVENVMSLAWLAKAAAPTTTLRFRWTLDYCFVWSEVGKLAPGIAFQAEQVWDVEDWGTSNRVTFKMLPGGVFTFAEQSAGPDDKDLYVVGDETLPLRQASVGIGMAGSPIYVVPAQPNTSWIFTPKPRYWVTFGSIETGEVLDVESITRKAVEVVFPEGVFSMTVVLSRYNTWSVFPSE